MPWAKGESGNPAGRPKGSLSVYESLQRALERKWVVPDGEDKGEVKTKLDQLCRSMVELAIGGSVPAAQWVGDRFEGRVTSKVELSGTQSNNVVVVPWLPATEDAIQAARRGGLPGGTGAGTRAEPLDLNGVTVVDQVAEGEAEPQE